MKKHIKLLLEGIGKLLQTFLNFPIPVFILDTFVNAWYFKFNESDVMGEDYSI